MIDIYGFSVQAFFTEINSGFRRWVIAYCLNL